MSRAIGAILTAILITQVGVPAWAAGPPTLFDRIGIGADWGPHWATSPTAGDIRDNQADGAFPAEICLLRNAGFKTIRMYGENASTWLAVLDAVEDYNRGKLNCNPAGGPASDCSTSGACMSVVHPVGICGPDPRSLAWNGSFAQIDQVKCYEIGPSGSAPVVSERAFKDSVDAELLKLNQIIANAGEKFAANVSLVLVGNEILFSRGVCSNGGAACTDNRDCSGGSCDIGHFCSNQLSGATPTAPCSSAATCGGGATCTDVTNVAPLAYAFGQVQQALTQLPGSPPPISISLQMDLLVSPSFGDDPKTAPLMWSRQLLGQALPNKIMSVNTYPDQWGTVTINHARCACRWTAIRILDGSTPIIGACTVACPGVCGWSSSGSRRRLIATRGLSRTLERPSQWQQGGNEPNCPHGVCCKVAQKSLEDRQLPFSLVTAR